MEVVLPLKQMTTEDKLRVLEAVWEDLCRVPQNVPSPAWHEDVLRAREKRMQEGSSQMVDWPDAKQKIRDAAR
ncbi:MAG: addiction module protein [Candidatus Nealsonbacteria bacterium]|nr:addiction module protein [Candidatus Nealsonbacteria bacterium]